MWHEGVMNCGKNTFSGITSFSPSPLALTSSLLSCTFLQMKSTEPSEWAEGRPTCTTSLCNTCEPAAGNKNSITCVCVSRAQGKGEMNVNFPQIDIDLGFGTSTHQRQTRLICHDTSQPSGSGWEYIVNITRAATEAHQQQKRRRTEWLTQVKCFGKYKSVISVTTINMCMINSIFLLSQGMSFNFFLFSICVLESDSLARCHIRFQIQSISKQEYRHTGTALHSV